MAKFHPDDFIATWYWEAHGSGIWLNLGSSVVVPPLSDRMETFRRVELLKADGKYDPWSRTSTLGTKCQLPGDPPLYRKPHHPGGGVHGLPDGC